MQNKAQQRTVLVAGEERPVTHPLTPLVDKVAVPATCVLIGILIGMYIRRPKAA